MVSFNINSFASSAADPHYVCCRALNTAWPWTVVFCKMPTEIKSSFQKRKPLEQ